MDWQQAWEAAQPSISSLKQQCQDFPRTSPRIQRVVQIDAELLDEELLQILVEPVAKALSLINSSYASLFEPEYAFILRLLLYKFSVWDLGATYGAKLQNLRYAIPIPSRSKTLAPSGIPKRILFLHGIMTVFIPYLHRRLRIYALSHAWPDAPSKDTRRKAWESLTRYETIHDALSLVSFVAFLYNGKYRTIADRLLHLQLVPAQRTTSRQVSYEFMNRQMVWHAFTEFLIFLLPLINARILRRRLSRVYEQTLSWTKRALSFESTHSDQKQSRNGKYSHIPEDQCAICLENAGFLGSTSLQSVYPHPLSTASKAKADSSYPLNTPYITSCLHKYCYVCIAGRLLRAVDDGDTGWECLRCGSAVLTAHRVTNVSDKDSVADLDEVSSEASEDAEFLTSTELNAS